MNDQSITWIRVVLMMLLILAIVGCVFVSYVYIYLPIHAGITDISNTIQGSGSQSSTSISSHIDGLENDSQQLQTNMIKQVSDSMTIVHSIQQCEAKAGNTTIDNNSTLTNVATDCDLLTTIATEIQDGVNDFKTKSENFITETQTTIDGVLLDIQNAPTNIRCATICFLLGTVELDTVSTEDQTFYACNCSTFDCDYDLPVIPPC
jgi:hypothetical protein